jgi:cytoskeletal protein CcmA (bactofilin family)
MLPKRRLQDRVGNPATVLGHGARFEGQISGSGHFLIAGEVQGNAVIEGALTLTEGSRWKGTIVVDDAILAGEFDGELNAKGKIELTATARVKGKIAAASIAMAQGAVVQGDVTVASEDDVRRFEEQRDQ